MHNDSISRIRNALIIMIDQCGEKVKKISNALPIVRCQWYWRRQWEEIAWQCGKSILFTFHGSISWGSSKSNSCWIDIFMLCQWCSRGCCCCIGQWRSRWRRSCLNGIVRIRTGINSTANRCCICWWNGMSSTINGCRSFIIFIWQWLRILTIN